MGLFENYTSIGEKRDILTFLDSDDKNSVLLLLIEKVLQLEEFNSELATRLSKMRVIMDGLDKTDNENGDGDDY